MNVDDANEHVSKMKSALPQRDLLHFSVINVFVIDVLPKISSQEERELRLNGD